MAANDYMINLPDPSRQIGNALQLGQMAETIKTQQSQAQAQQQMQAALAKVAQNPTPAALTQLMVQYPSLSENFKRTYDVLDQQHKDAKVGEASKVYAALNAGQNDIAIDLLNEQAAAYRNSGMEKEAKTMEDLAQVVKLSPETAMTSTGLFLANAMGQDKFIDTFKGLEEARIAAGEIPDTEKEFLKEERQQARTTVNNLKKRASEINESFGKVESLIGQIKQGKSRAATGAAVMSVARLISPGVVTDRDAQTISGSANPAQEMISILLDRGDKSGAERMRKSLDPLNPELFDADGLLEVAKSVTAAEAPVILQQLEEAKIRAKTAKMSETAYNTNFQNLGSIEALSRFVTKNPVGNAKQAVAIEGMELLTPEEQAELQALEAEFGGQ